MIVVGFMSFMLPTINPPIPILGLLQMCGIPAMFVGLWLFLTGGVNP